jgi:signal transduction histidine kinase
MTAARNDSKQIEELERRHRQLTLLFELAQLGTSSLDSKVIVDRMLTLMLDALAVDGVMIHLLHADRLRLEGHRSRQNLPEEALSGLRDMPIDDTSISGRAAKARRTVRIPEESTFPARSVPASRAGRIQCALGTPLIATERLVGTVLVVRRVLDAFADDEIKLVESCAAHIAAVIAHARLFEGERRRAQELGLLNELGRLITEQLDLEAVLDTGVRHLSQLTNAPQTFLMLYGPGRQTLRMVASNVEAVFDISVKQDEPSVVTRAIRERRPIIVNDLETADANLFNAARVARLGQKALVAVPLVSRGEPIGAVLLADTDPRRRFDETEVERAVAVSNQLATAIANAQLFEDLRASYRELERAQERYVQRERLAAIGEMAASIAHEVRNPLGVIFNSLASLRRMIPASPDAEMLLSIAGEEADRLNRIVADLLDFARPSEPRLQAESVAAVIHGAVDSAMNAEGVPAGRIQLELDESIPRLAIDPQLLRQALINLLVNALQASPPQQPVKVCARIERTDARSFVRIDVSDRGPGIPAAAASQIFQPFYTTKAKGTGLGLAIVKRIVEAHQGRILFDSVKGRGTTFTVRIPLDSTGV